MDFAWTPDGYTLIAASSDDSISVLRWAAAVHFAGFCPRSSVGCLLGRGCWVAVWQRHNAVHASMAAVLLLAYGV